MYPNPQQYPPGGPQQYAYQGPPPKKSGAGCWLWGLLGCFGVLIVCGVLGFLAFRSVTKTFGGAMQGGMQIAAASKNLQVINTAVKSFQRDHGAYPVRLSQLVPNYLPSASVLHTAADPNPNPNHVSYTYVQPTSSTPQNVPYLSTSVTYSMTISTQTVTQTTVMKMALDGFVTQQQSQTQTMGTSNSGSIGNSPSKGF